MKLAVKIDLCGRFRISGDFVITTGQQPIWVRENKSEGERWGIPYPGDSAGYEVCLRWKQTIAYSPQYQNALRALFDAQKEKPIWCGKDGSCHNLWAFDGRLFFLNYEDGLDDEEIELAIRHYFLSLHKHFKSIQREIKAFENLDRLIHRDPIPESIRLYVWQRDQGKCVECGRKDGLEFDHIIPIKEGGNSTERNVQLLCLRCNRQKGQNV